MLTCGGSLRPARCEKQAHHDQEELHHEPDDTRHERIGDGFRAVLKVSPLPSGNFTAPGTDDENICGEPEHGPQGLVTTEHRDRNPWQGRRCRRACRTRCGARTAGILRDQRGRYGVPAIMTFDREVSTAPAFVNPSQGLILT